MKRWWNTLSARIDALSLRERVFLFAALLAVSLVLADVLWLSPQQTVHQQLTQRVKTQQAELERLRDELQRSGAETGSGKQMRDELGQIRERLVTVNEAIARTPMAAADATPLSSVLVHFLRRHEGLVLVRTATLAPDNRSEAAGVEAGVRRQGLELTVAGPYPQLTGYVQTLERALPALRWGAMTMRSESNRPTELSLQVWLVGAAP